MFVGVRKPALLQKIQVIPEKVGLQAEATQQARGLQLAQAESPPSKSAIRALFKQKRPGNAWTANRWWIGPPKEEADADVCFGLGEELPGSQAPVPECQE